jgi:hypothetical protein
LPRLGSRVRIPSPAPIYEQSINDLAKGGSREPSSEGALRVRYPFGGRSGPPQRKAPGGASGRGGLRQQSWINNLARGETAKLAVESLCFVPRAYHQAGAPPPEHETAAPVTSRGSGTTRQSNPNSQIYPAPSSPDKAALAPATAVRPIALNVSSGQPREAKKEDCCRTRPSDIGTWISVGEAADRALSGIFKNMGKSDASRSSA